MILKKRPYISNFLLGLVGGCVFFPSCFFFLLFSFSLTSFLKHQHQGFKTDFWTTFFFCWGFFMVPLYWIPNALWVELDSFGWMIPFCFAGIPACLGVIYTIISFIIPWRFTTGALRVFLFACWWVGAEIVTSFIFTGFPWALLGYAWQNLSMLQFTHVASIYGLSFFSILLWGAPYVTRSSPSKISAYFWMIMVVWVAIYGWGKYRLDQNPTRTTPLRIRLVQPNIAQEFKWDPLQLEAHLETLSHLTQIPARKAPHLIVWPEAAYGFDLERNHLMRLKVTSILPPRSILITGAVRYGTQQAFNSLFALNADGKILATYDKHHLVPFGEYIPLRPWLELIFPPGYLRKITAGIGDFGEGKGPSTLHIAGIPAVSPLICYEAIFPGQAIDATTKPTWLLNVTNDAWFGDSAGPRQHLHIARVRAIEEGLPLIRVANTGISAIIDPCGRIVASLPLNTKGVLDGYLPQPLKD